MASYPSTDDFTPLDDHQAQTPSTFFGGKPVLYAHAAGCRLIGSQANLAAVRAFGQLGADSLPAVNGNADHDEAGVTVTCEGVDVFVNSQDVLLANKSASGEPQTLRIPYQSISIHATQRLYSVGSTSGYTASAPSEDAQAVHAILLQLDPGYATRAQENPDHEDLEADATLTLVPPHTGGQPNETLAQAIFEAMSRCADLHPDPDDDDDDDDDGAGASGGVAVIGGGGMPGEGGWITSENAHEFADQFADAEEDEHGEGGGGTGLGEGAGTRRGRGTDDRADDGDDDDESKWQRTG